MQVGNKQRETQRDVCEVITLNFEADMEASCFLLWLCKSHRFI